MSAAARLYAWLLHLYPAEFRRRFGSAMIGAFEDRASAARRRGSLARAATVAAGFTDLAVNAVAIRLSTKEKATMNWQAIGMDARYAARTLRRSPLFTALAVGALALGIGANTAIFTVVDGVLLKPLPYADPGRLAMVWSTNTAEHRDRDVVSPLDFLDFTHARSFAGLEAYYSFVVGAPLQMPDGAEQILVSGVTTGMFDMLGRAPVLGRNFTPADIPTAVIVSDGFWRARLGSDPGVIGRPLNIDNRSRTIIGVMPRDFVFPYKTMLGPSGFTRSTDVDAWLPLAFVSANSRATGDVSLTRAARFLAVVGRLHPGVTVAQANAELTGIARQIAATHPDTNTAVGVNLVGLHEQAVGGTRSALMLLMGGVGFVLLMACVNLANMLLARSTARQREMAIRSALGAARTRLIAQALVESTLLSLTGGAVAIALVRWTLALLVSSAPGDMPRIGEVHVDGSVLAFTILLSGVTGLVIGLLPALAASRPELQSALKESSRGATAGRSHRRWRSGLVVAEVALALVLTLGTGLLIRSFLSVLSIDPGFRSDHLLTLQIAVPAKYQTADSRRVLYANLFARLEALPGVVSAGGTTRLPLGSTNVTTKLGVDGRSTAIADWPEVEFRRSVRHYFAAMDIPILRGRDFTDRDGPNAPPVVVINDALAKRVFLSEDPIGRRVRLGSPDGTPLTIVGVIGDVRHSGLEAPPSPEIYTTYLQNPPVNPFLVIRATVDPASLAASVRSAVQSVDNTIAVYDLRTMAQVKSEAMSERRFLLMLVAAFGVLALVMAAVGVYGVMALIVNERTPEIGIRLALGAEPRHLVRSVVAHGCLLAAVGIAAGFAASAAVAPLLETELYGIRLLDPPTMASVPALLLAVAAAACYIPARRALTVDPVTTLRM